MKLTMREFRANLRKYLDLIKEGEVFEVGGVQLCMYTDKPDYSLEGLEKKLDEICELIKEKATIKLGGAGTFENTFKGNPVMSPQLLDRAKSNFVNPVQETFEGSDHDDRFNPCALCGKQRQLYLVFQDGEREVCGPCIKRTMGKRADSFMATAQKVAPTEELAKAAPVEMKPQAKFNDDPIQYCSKCMFRAVYNGQKTCSKCSSKKKK